MISSPRSTSSPAAVRTRQVKLRNACNQCCAAKVKCSGERSGCQRCRNARAQCVYMESRVGKVPGVRARKKQIHGNTPQQFTNSLTDQRAGSITSVPDIDFQNHEQDGVMELAGDWNIEASDTITGEFSTGSQVSRQSTAEEPSFSSGSIIAFYSTEEYELTTTDEDMEDLLTSQSPIPTLQAEQTTQASPPPHLQLSLGLRPRSEADSQCFLECCQIINDLENYIMAEMKSFKIVLGITRKALEKLSHLIQLQQSSRNLRCLMLFSTLMYQILELLEVCLSTVAADRDRQQSRNSIGGLSGLGFGDFSLDAEEQSAIRIQTILKETQQATETLGNLRTLAGMGPDLGAINGSSDSPRGKARVECYTDLEFRFKDLTARLGRMS